MSITLHVWHLLVLVSFALVGISFVPVQGDTYGVGAFLRAIALLVVILLIWLGYFAGRFLMG